MGQKRMVKIGLDLIMTVLLLCQMAYLLIGEEAHEWLGTAMFVLFILHHILNWRWYQNLTKGNYHRVRILQMAVNFLVFLSMIGLMISGIMMSREVFAFLPIHGGRSFARTLHMLASYWGFLFMSLHLGLHWGMIIGMARKIWGKPKFSSAGTWILRILGGAIGILGIYSFVTNKIADYMFLRTEFVFFDMSKPLWLFFAEYLSMMGLWVWLAYYGTRLLRNISSKQKKNRQ